MSIGVEDIYKNNRIIIDIRAAYQFVNHHIDKSINIVENKLLLNPSYYLDKNNEYVIYCEYGYRSSKVASYLNNLGYKVYSLNGGYQEYLNNLN